MHRDLVYCMKLILKEFMQAQGNVPRPATGHKTATTRFFEKLESYCIKLRRKLHAIVF